MTKIARRDVIRGIAASAAMVPFVPAIGRTQPVTFLAMGDWGRDGTQHQRDVAIQMGRTAAASRARFVISVGDNFYENGVRSLDDPQWTSSFENIYTDPALQVPWYVALGNHDYHGNPQAQVDYSRHSRRWTMPTRYFTVPGARSGLADTEIFVIDSSPLVHKYRADVAKPVATNIVDQDVAVQLAWLDRELARSTAAWKLVIGHHTIRSGGSGHGETPELVALIEPLLRKHRVQAYINGHDHDMQHIRRDGVDYICCGAGSEVRPVDPVEGTLFCLSRSGFAVLTRDVEGLTLEFRDYTGASVYRARVAAGSQRAAA